MIQDKNTHYDVTPLNYVSSSPNLTDRDLLKLFLTEVAIHDDSQKEMIERSINDQAYFLVGDSTNTCLLLPYDEYQDIITDFIDEFNSNRLVKEMYIEDKRYQSVVGGEPILKLICNVEPTTDEDKMLEICQSQLEIIWKYDSKNVDVYIVTSKEELKSRFPNAERLGK